MDDQAQMRFLAPGVRVGMRQVLVGKRLRNRPEGDVEPSARRVPGAQARPVRRGHQPHPPPVPA